MYPGAKECDLTRTFSRNNSVVYTAAPTSICRVPNPTIVSIAAVLLAGCEISAKRFIWLIAIQHLQEKETNKCGFKWSINVIFKWNCNRFLNHYSMSLSFKELLNITNRLKQRYKYLWFHLPTACPGSRVGRTSPCSSYAAMVVAIGDPHYKHMLNWLMIPTFPMPPIITLGHRDLFAFRICKSNLHLPSFQRPK